MKGIILTNAYKNIKSVTEQASRLKEELALLGAACDIRLNFGIAEIKDGGVFTRDFDYDFCVYYDKDKYVSEMLEKKGVRLFNKHASIRDCDDKMRTLIRLAETGLNLPDTLSAPVCYDEGTQPTESEIKDIIARVGLPFVIKKAYGSCGTGVSLVKNEREAKTLISELMLQPHLYQRFVSSSYGKDVRIMVIGGKAVSAMLRSSKADFRSNINAGGFGENYEPSEPFISAAELAARTLDLDYCGVDLLFGERGVPVICEVNSNAFITATEQVTGVNVSRLYAQHIVKTMKSERGIT